MSDSVPAVPVPGVPDGAEASSEQSWVVICSSCRRDGDREAHPGVVSDVAIVANVKAATSILKRASALRLTSRSQRSTRNCALTSVGHGSFKPFEAQACSHPA